jgi:small subunit ribosomal protein S8
MVMTDPISDMLTRVRNAIKSRHARTEMPSSKIKTEIAKILMEEGYIDGFKVIDDPSGKNRLVLTLRYGPAGESVLTGLERISRPGRRIYARTEAVPVVLGGIGFAVVSTSQGIMSSEAAKKRKLGGEILCKVW